MIFSSSRSSSRFAASPEKVRRCARLGASYGRRASLPREYISQAIPAPTNPTASGFATVLSRKLRRISRAAESVRGRLTLYSDLVLLAIAVATDHIAGVGAGRQLIPR